MVSVVKRGPKNGGATDGAADSSAVPWVYSACPQTGSFIQECCQKQHLEEVEEEISLKLKFEVCIQIMHGSQNPLMPTRVGGPWCLAHLLRALHQFLRGSVKINLQDYWLLYFI